MEIFIPIDKNTIRPNPEAGQTTIYIAGKPIVKEIIVENGKRFVYLVSNDQLVLISVESCSEPNSMRKEINTPFQKLHTTPQEKWSYEYIEDITCCCGWIGVLDQLEEYDSCPNCYEQHTIKHESISQQELT